MNELRDLKEWLELHFDDLKEKAPDRKQEINDLYAAATVAYETSLNASLVPEEGMRAMTDDLIAIQADITRRMEQNEDIAGTIDKVTAAVGIATKIAGILISA